MTAFSAKDVKELRERTGAGMMDCKKALEATNGVLEEAVDWLRKKGLATAAKKAGRAAAEGLVGIQVKGTTGVLIEVNAETDFVARNDQFQTYVKTVSDMVASSKDDLETLKAKDYPGTGRTVADELTNLVAVIGENMSFRRLARVSVSQGAVANYLHNTIGEGLGRVGVLVGLESAASQDVLLALGKQIAMHIAAAHPLCLQIEDMDQEVLGRERAIIEEQAKQSGKPADVIEKLVAGRLRKFYEESVLLEQVFLIDDSKRKISQVVEDKAKEIGTDIKLVGFAHFKLGDGVEKQETDFAAEVAELSK
jgi:elongation factor Ts